jgi:hypothetical protein
MTKIRKAGTAIFTRYAGPNSPMVDLTQECETILSIEV